MAKYFPPHPHPTPTLHLPFKLQHNRDQSYSTSGTWTLVIGKIQIYCRVPQIYIYKQGLLIDSYLCLELIYPHILQICRCSCEKKYLKMIADAEKLFELCFLSQWIPKAQPCESENILYFIWKGWKLPELWWKTHVLVGRPAPPSSISSVCEASVEESDGIILPCEGGISEGQLAHLCFQLDFSAPPVGSLAGHWVLAPGHLSSSYPPLSLCPSCAVRLASVEAEDQQTLGICLSLFYVHSLWHVGS